MTTQTSTARREVERRLATPAAASAALAAVSVAPARLPSRGRWRPAVAAVCLVGIAVGWAWLGTRPRSNADVLAVAYAFPDGGGYADLKDTGVPEDVVHAGQTILRKNAGGSSYCCGFTFAVVMKTARDRGLLASKRPADVKQFQREWYGATPESALKQVVPAMEHLGVGHEVAPADARAGDFIAFYRENGSGHSAVFLDWVRDSSGVVIGFRYRSSQNWTLGIADQTEFFTTSGRADGEVDPKRFAVARLK